MAAADRERAAWQVPWARSAAGKRPTDRHGNLPKGYEAWAYRQRDRERRDDPGHAGLPPLRGTPEVVIERLQEVQAAGIATAMQIIRGQLSELYVQHEAIEAQKMMVNSPNHTVVYIPSGNMGVPLAATFDADRRPR